MNTVKTHRLFAIAACFAFVASLAFACLIAAPWFSQQAYADSYIPFVSGSVKKDVRIAKTVTAKEKKAYQRALEKCLDYENQPNPIVVDVSDLGLTDAQALHVGYLLHSNGELFWTNTYDDNSFKRDKFTIPCYFEDKDITAKRARLEIAVAKALKCITPKMDNAVKIHALHDYIIDRVDYGQSYKTAYNGLVEGKGDCYGFALSMDLLLRRAGFTVDMAYRNDGQHAWNLAKVDGKWYHVDTCWDNGYSYGGKGTPFWKNGKCHLYLLQSDGAMAEDSHAGWWAHNKCTTKTYYRQRLHEYKRSFDKRCYEYKIYTSGLKSKKIKYQVISPGKVKVMSVYAAKAKSARLSIPQTVTYKGVAYKVVGINGQALSGTKVKTLEVSSAAFSAGNLKNSLLGSAVKQVKLKGNAVKKKAAYKRYFKSANSGKQVTVS